MAAALVLSKKLEADLALALRALSALTRRRTMTAEDCCEFWKKYGPVVKLAIQTICPVIGPGPCNVLKKLAAMLDKCCRSGGKRARPKIRVRRVRPIRRPRRTPR